MPLGDDVLAPEVCASYNLSTPFLRPVPHGMLVTRWLGLFAFVCVCVHVCVDRVESGTSTPYMNKAQEDKIHSGKCLARLG